MTLRPDQLGRLLLVHRYLIYLRCCSNGNTATDCYLAVIASVSEADFVKNNELLG